MALGGLQWPNAYFRAPTLVFHLLFKARGRTNKQGNLQNFQDKHTQPLL